jgi:hypothetical protein
MFPLLYLLSMRIAEGTKLFNADLEWSVPTLVKARLAARRKSTGLKLLQSPDLKRVPWLVHGFTTRPGGFTTSYGGRSLNVGFTKDDLRANVEHNRKAALLAAEAATKSKP